MLQKVLMKNRKHPSPSQKSQSKTKQNKQNKTKQNKNKTVQNKTKSKEYHTLTPWGYDWTRTSLLSQYNEYELWSLR